MDVIVTRHFAVGEPSMFYASILYSLRHNVTPESCRLVDAEAFLTKPEYFFCNYNREDEFERKQRVSRWWFQRHRWSDAERTSGDPRSLWRHLLRHRDAGNSRQHSVDDRVATMARGAQKLVGHLPGSVSNQRRYLPVETHLSPPWSRRKPPPAAAAWFRLVVAWTRGIRSHPWTPACARLHRRTPFRYSPSAAGFLWMRLKYFCERSGVTRIFCQVLRSVTGFSSRTNGWGLRGSPCGSGRSRAVNCQTT